MLRLFFLLSSLVAVPLFALRLVGKSGSNIQLSDYQRFENKEVSFLTQQWLSLRADLAQLESIGNSSSKSVVAGRNSTSNKHKRFNATAAIASADVSVKGPVDKGQLRMMLAMLEGLYDSQKDRIVEINKHEEKSKKRYDEQLKAYNSKCAALDLERKRGKWDDGFYKNMTRDNAHQFDYVKRCRERDHKQFHNSLKLTHATMSKEKTMVKAYTEALAGPTPKNTKDASKQLAKVEKDSGMPEIVFVQQAQAIVHFCQESRADVQNAMKELNDFLSAEN